MLIFTICVLFLHDFSVRSFVALALGFGLLIVILNPFPGSENEYNSYLSILSFNNKQYLSDANMYASWFKSGSLNTTSILDNYNNNSGASYTQYLFSLIPFKLNFTGLFSFIYFNAVQYLGLDSKIYIILTRLLLLFMTVWDVFCQDKSGNVRQVKARVLYPENAYDTSFDNSSEGSFVHYLYKFDWKPGRDYRLLLQQSVGNNGNVLLTLWLKDLEAGNWTELYCFDTGLPDIWISSAAGFVENPNPSVSAYPRAIEFWNIRACMKKSGKWVKGLIRFHQQKAARLTDQKNSGIKNTTDGEWTQGALFSLFFVLTNMQQLTGCLFIGP